MLHTPPVESLLCRREQKSQAAHLEPTHGARLGSLFPEVILILHITEAAASKEKELDFPSVMEVVLVHRGS